MKKIVLPFAPVLFLTFPALAQQDESPLVIRTSDERIAKGVARTDLFTGDLPATADDLHLVFRLNEEGRISGETAEGDCGLITITARPVEMMDIFAEEIDQARQQAQGMASMALAGSGVKPKDAMNLVRTLFEFPAQIEQLEIKVLGDPDKPEAGFDVSIRIDAVDDSWLAGLIASVRPSTEGAPVVEGSADLVRATISADLVSTEPWQPLVGFVAGMNAKSDKDREEWAALASRSFASTAGPMTMLWSSTGMRMLTLLNDAKEMGAVMSDPGYGKWTENGGPQADIEFEPSAFTHRDTRVARLITELRGPAKQMAGKDGVDTSYRAVAGKYRIEAAHGLSADDMKGIIDAAIDGKIERRPLAGDRLIDVDLKLSAFASRLFGGGAPGPMPSNVALAVSKEAGALLIDLTILM